MSDPISKFEHPVRLKEINIESILSMLSIHENSVICDYGAGTGIFTIPMAKRTKGQVLAMDMSNDMLQLVEEKAVANQIDNVKTIKVEADKIACEDKSIDVFVLVTVLHEINNIPAFIKEIRRVLKQDGKVLVVDFQRKESPIGPPIHSRVSAYETTRHLLKEDIYLDHQQNLSDNFYMVIGKKH